MELAAYFRSMVEQDRCAVVICDLSHEIIYMNPAAISRHAKRGDLVGKSIMTCHNENSRRLIEEVVEWFAKDKENNIVHTFFNEKEQKDVYMVALRDENGVLIGYYEKHEYRTKDDSEFYALK